MKKTVLTLFNLILFFIVGSVQAHVITATPVPTPLTDTLKEVTALKEERAAKIVSDNLTDKKEPE